MRFHRMVVSLFVMPLTIIPCLASEIVRGHWEQVEILKPGTGIVVKLKAGDRVTGTYQALNGEALRIKNISGSDLACPSNLF